MIRDHDLRYDMANELHARPFPLMAVPGRAAYLAIKRPTDAANRDKSADREHLVALLDRYGVPHPPPGATHYSGDLGLYSLKWENHTEFVTYTLFSKGVAETPFDGESFKAFPAAWLADAPGERITSGLIRVEQTTDLSVMESKLRAWFVDESLAVSSVADKSAVVASDFRIDAAGHLRFAVFADPGADERRIGRIVQRLCEIETYKSMSMLGLAMARDLNSAIAPIEDRLSDLVGDLSGDITDSERNLRDLLGISAALEQLSTRSSFRFGATGAYEALVHQRIALLREERFEGRQTFAEFMIRRFDPAMRTVKSYERRLADMTARAVRAGDLLRTRVDVERQSQNQQVLESMDRRADLQLRLQKTVEGLSVVAISYYAVNLSLYVLGPMTVALGLSKTLAAALVTPLVVLAVWYLVHRIRNAVEKH